MRRAIPGTNFSELPERYVIFITETGAVCGELPICNVSYKVEETGRSFGDGGHIIYVNGRNKDSETALGRLMHDLFCPDLKQMYDKMLENGILLEQVMKITCLSEAEIKGN